MALSPGLAILCRRCYFKGQSLYILTNPRRSDDIECMRRPRHYIKGPETRFYHALSRVVDRQLLFGDPEKEFFRNTLRKIEAFSGVHVLDYSIMGNHFHLILEVPPRQSIDDKELIRRLRCLYPKAEVDEFAQQLREWISQGLLNEAQKARDKFLARMFDLSSFMKDLLQRVTQCYNTAHDRKGTLWEERFKAVLIQGEHHALLTVAAYIGLNPVRAGLCLDPKDYRFCGYAEALAGGRAARQGLLRLLRVYQPNISWKSAQARYRIHLFGKGEQRFVPGPGESAPPAFSREQVLEVIRQQGEVSLPELLRLRVRYFSAGLVLGGKDFVNDWFREHQESFAGKRRDGARPMKGGQSWGELTTFRNLQKDVLS